MTKHYALSAEARDRAGKGVARSLRREDRIPAVIYGDGKPPVSISLPLKEVTLEYHKGHMYTTLCDLKVESDKHLVLIRDVQVHPVTDRVLHLDFLRVTPKTKLDVQVPVHFINHDTCPGLKNKGVLNVVRHEVELKCLATSIPESVEVDLSPFDIGDAIKISDAVLPQGTVPSIKDRDFTLATILPPRLLLEEEPVAEEGADEDKAEGAEGDAKDGDKAKAAGDKPKADKGGK